MQILFDYRRVNLTAICVKRTKSLNKSTKSEGFCSYLTFFNYLCHVFPRSLLDDCRLNGYLKAKTAHAVPREVKFSDGVERGGQHQKSRKVIPYEVGSGK
ncbi:MAG: hypothetical protein IKH52_01960 [Bacteroidaceae bacterium]|nr:hypothetical protein [Bacteroidaceae bacterium]